MSNHNGFLNRLKKKGKIETRSGGYSIVLPLDYGTNATYTRYSGYDDLNISQSDVFTSAEYDWRQVAIHVTASGRELRMNSGKEAMINLVKSRITNAMRTAANTFSVDLYGSGSLTNQITGLGTFITTAGTGTAGGIDAGTYTWWGNQYEEAAGTNALSGTTDLPNNTAAAMNRLYLKTKRGTDETDLIILSHDFYVAWEGSLQNNQRYMDADMAKQGFLSLKYKKADVIHDNNTNFSTTAETGYFLNTDFIYLVEHPEARWSQDDKKIPLTQDAEVVPIYWMGNLVCSNRARQGRLLDAS